MAKLLKMSYTLKISMDYIDIGENVFIMIASDDLTREVQLAKVKDIVIRLNNMLSKYHSLDDYFDDILRSLVEVIPYAELGSILLVDENNYMTMRANVGYGIDQDLKTRMEEIGVIGECGFAYGLVGFPEESIAFELNLNIGCI